MPISFSFDEHSVTISSSFDKELNMSDLEEEFYNSILELLSDTIDTSLIRVERRSDAYVSAIYGENNNFLRFKLSDKTKWISIFLTFDDKKDNMDNPLFEAQKNKKQFHWKSKLSNSKDYSVYKQFLINSCLEHS